jgi:GntR family transcriptional regulator
MFLRIDPNNGIPLGVQICAGLRLAVATQRLRAGDRLPSARDLAGELRVNFHTVRKAFADLEAEGVLETRRGLGTFVAATQRAGRTELKRVVREQVDGLLGQLAGGEVDHDEVRTLWLEEWERRTNAARRKS